MLLSGGWYPFASYKKVRKRKLLLVISYEGEFHLECERSVVAEGKYKG